MQLAASTIADLHKSRWEVEMFFRNLKQLLRVKSFVGISRMPLKSKFGRL